jgi:hypothetical protein
MAPFFLAAHLQTSHAFEETVLTRSKKLCVPKRYRGSNPVMMVISSSITFDDHHHLHHRPMYEDRLPR